MASTLDQWKFLVANVVRLIYLKMAASSVSEHTLTEQPGIQSQKTVSTAPLAVPLDQSAQAAGVGTAPVEQSGPSIDHIIAAAKDIADVGVRTIIPRGIIKSRVARGAIGVYRQASRPYFARRRFRRYGGYRSSRRRVTFRRRRYYR